MPPQLGTVETHGGGEETPTAGEQGEGEQGRREQGWREQGEGELINIFIIYM